MILSLINISLPFTNPVIIFALVLFIILLAPIILKKFKIPGIVGLILSGMIIGPNGIHLLERDSSIILFGTVGLLYIMFLAGLELDLNDVKKNKNRSLLFGFFTFTIPLALGFVVCHYLLNYDFTGSLLIASMFSTHTLVAYPIASRLGIIKNQAVAVTVGGTIITDVAVLLVLAIITASSRGNLNIYFWIQLVLSLSAFSFIVFWGFPRISRWFFKNIDGENHSQYIFVLAMLFTAGFLAELAGVEPIIGAFLAGLALNRMIPHSSSLMDKIDFAGNALFIPFFLISVGMIIDLRVLAKGTEAIIVAVVLTIVALLTKWLAAFLTQKVFGYTVIERKLIFGLSASHAAATLAVIIIGFNLGIINEAVLNGTIVLILITCLTSSFVTENAGRQQAIVESDKKVELETIPERILVPVANPESIEKLIEFALYIKDRDSEEMIYPLSIVMDNDNTNETIISNKKKIENVVRRISAQNLQKMLIINRIDVNTSSGILRAMKEMLITDVVIGLNVKLSASGLFFGSLLDSILDNSSQMIFVVRDVQPLNTVKKLFVGIPENSSAELGFERCILKILHLASQIGAELTFGGFNESLSFIKLILKNKKYSNSANYIEMNDDEDFIRLSKMVTDDDMIIFINSRPKSVSHDIRYESIINRLSEKLEKINFAVVYPEQNPVITGESITKYDILDTSPIRQNIEVLALLGNKIKKLLKLTK